MLHNKYWNLSGSLIISCAIFLVFMATQSLVLLLMKPAELVATPLVYENLAYSNLGLISSSSSFIGIALVLFFIYLKKTKIQDYLHLYFPTLRVTGLFLLLSILLMFLMEFLSQYYPHLFDTDFVLKSYQHAKSLPLFYLGVVFLGPVFEEFLFRGFLFKSLELSVFGGHGAVFITAIIFSIIHIQYGLPIIIFMLFPMAIVLGYARLQSKSLVLPIVLHIINNFITCIVTHLELY